MSVYVPGTQEKDLSKVIMSVQAISAEVDTNVANIATNTAAIAANTANIATNTSNISSLQSLLSGYLFGLTLSAAGTSSTFSIAAGKCADITAAAVMSLSALSKTTSAWAVGSGNGALDTGAIANSTWYHVFIIQRVDTGVVDALVSLSSTSPTMPTSYTLKRRIGSLRTDGSAHWYAFSQVGDDFYWTIPFNNASALTIGASRTLVTLTAPPNTIAKIRSLGFNAASVSSFIIQPTAETDAAPNVGGYSIASEVANGGTGAPTQLPVDSSSQIAVRADRASCVLYLWTWSWVDRRGKDA